MSVLATFLLITGASKKTSEMVKVLDQVFYICYLMKFPKNKGKYFIALINFNNKVNTMTLIYTAKLGFKVEKTKISNKKIDGSSLKTFSIVFPTFQVLDKLNQSWFLKKMFLLANNSMKKVLDMLFLTFSNADV